MKILLLDIESSPHTAYVWGLWNENIPLARLIDSSKVLCFAAKWYGDAKIQFCSAQKIGHKRMLAKAHALLSEADVVVHYYGTRFDIPVLNKEFLLHGFSPPAPFKQIDLCKVARRQFKFASNKLDWIAQSLGLGQKVRHKGFELWVECMRNDPEAWKQMEVYNVQDVALLEKVYDRLLPWIANHPSYGAYTRGDRLICTNCGGSHIQYRGYAIAKTLKYRRAQCKDCGKWLRSNKSDTPRGEERLIGVS